MVHSVLSHLPQVVGITYLSIKEPNSNQTFGLVQLTGLKSLVHQLEEGHY